MYELIKNKETLTTLRDLLISHYESLQELAYDDPDALENRIYTPYTSTTNAEALEDYNLFYSDEFTWSDMYGIRDTITYGIQAEIDIAIDAIGDFFNDDLDLVLRIVQNIHDLGRTIDRHFNASTEDEIVDSLAIIGNRLIRAIWRIR